MPLFQRVSEGLARKTSRRGFFGRGADVAFGTLAGPLAGRRRHRRDEYRVRLSRPFLRLQQLPEQRRLRQTLRDPDGVLLLGLLDQQWRRRPGHLLRL